MKSIIPTSSSVDVPDLDLQKIRRALAAHGSCLGVSKTFSHIRPQFDVHLFDALPSTNTRLWEMLAAGYSSGTVAIARRQTAGRGQHGRTWQSEPGGLYLSLALEPDWPAGMSAQLTCLSAWGIATAFNNLGIPLRVKWPNDLFFNGKKLGGILTETKLSYPPSQCEGTVGLSDAQPLIPPLIKQAVIGVGINWHNSVPETGTTLAKILSGGTYPTAQNKINCLEVLIALVLRGIMQGTFFYQQVGSQVFMKAYQKLLTQVGNVVSINYGMTDSVGFNDGFEVNSEDDFAERFHAQSIRIRQVRANSVGSFGASSGGSSGKVVGISEEGYLQVAFEKNSPASCHSNGETVVNHTADAADNVLLVKPSEIHIS
ncbi:MAG: biotin--[acetyl-CoA-carboxylase] ligase [Cyanobacteria bacterium J06623_4]